VSDIPVFDYDSSIVIRCNRDGPILESYLDMDWERAGYRQLHSSLGVANGMQVRFSLYSGPSIPDDDYPFRMWILYDSDADVAQLERRISDERRAAILGDYEAPPSLELRSSCPHCSGDMHPVRDHVQGRPNDAGLRKISVVACSCGYWEGYDVFCWDEDEDEDTQWRQNIQWMRYRARLRSFDISDAAVPIDALRRHLNKRPQDMKRIDPRRLERLVGDVFSEFFDCEALHVGGPGDNGIDLILLTGEHQLAVQVKRRSKGGSEGVSLIREFLGALVLEQHLNGLIVTTADSFSKPAIRKAKSAEELHLVQKIDLVDGGRLKELLVLESAAPEPWVRFAPNPSNPRPGVRLRY
jgi:hypothetical protein